MPEAPGMTRLRVEAHARRRRSIAETLVRALLGLWGGFTQYSDRELVLGQAAGSAVLVQQSSELIRREARAYASEAVRAVDARPEDRLPIVEPTYQRSGATEMEVYQRPANEALYAAKTLEEDPLVIEYRVKQRLRHLAEMDMILAERDEVATVFKASARVVAQRRVIHPELAQDGMSCGLCVVASANRYGPGELMPIHDGCNCTALPITAGNDPGLRLNRDDLDRLYDAAGGTAAELLRNTRVGLDEHGELGPILRREGSHWRDLADVNAGSERVKFTPFKHVDMDEQRADWRKMRDASQRAIARLADDPRPEAARASQFHRQLVSRLDTSLR
jgi:hypothetical protein